MMHRHRWVTVEQIGGVVTQKCSVCGGTRTRVRGTVIASPVLQASGHQHRTACPPSARTTPPTPHRAITNRRRNETP